MLLRDKTKTKLGLQLLLLHAIRNQAQQCSLCKKYLYELLMFLWIMRAYGLSLPTDKGKQFVLKLYDPKIVTRGDASVSFVY